ncbi:MAG: glutamate racemase, partial [Candidatus Omnitrophica bacterium]|nr:glutamate racemase [Candidatus Omnitrophota bacterium]
EGWLNGGITYDIAEKYLAPLRAKKIDTLILGCTHYPLLKAVIRRVMGPKVALIDSARQAAGHVKEVLSWENGLASNKKKGKNRFYVSDEPARFARIGEKFLGQKLGSVKKVNGYV